MDIRDTLRAWLDSGQPLTAEIVDAINGEWSACQSLPRISSTTPYLPPVATAGPEPYRLPDKPSPVPAPQTAEHDATAARGLHIQAEGQP